MMRQSAAFALGGLLLLASCASMSGKPAPDFSARDVSNRIVQLSDYQGIQNVILVFYRNHN